MDSLQRRESSEVVPTRRSSGSRALLPAEVELCESLGLTVDEYLYFQQLSDGYNGTRLAEYDQAGVPDVQCGPVALFFVNLAIGIALSAIGALLAPKPVAAAKTKTPPQMRTADKGGDRKYLQGEGFSSVQDVATLGAVIPVVFANRRNGRGGVRVNGMLLWSQLLSRGTGQQLKAAMLLSMGRLAVPPEFEGLAIGDQTLKNYTGSKMGVYYRPSGGRVDEADRYTETRIARDPNPSDILTVYSQVAGGWQPWFSSTRTPSTQTQFGCYSPMPNGSAYRVPYELVLTGTDASEQQEEGDDAKRNKIKTNFPSYASFYLVDSEDLQEDQTCVYQIIGTKESNTRFRPWGLDDVNAATEERRSDADQQIQVGDVYMAGDAVVVCVGRSRDEPWNFDTHRTYSFRCLEPGWVERRDAEAIDGYTYGNVLQRLAMATIANSRECDITEIGIKSVVWRQIAGFSNVNSEPSDQTIDEYEEKNGSIVLGTLNRYNRRRSFFRLQWRVLGTAGNWRDLSGGKLFFIEGRTPTAQYNFIRVEHPLGQYEFRLKPVPGNRIYASWMRGTVYQLGPMGLYTYSQNGLVVSFSGRIVQMDPEDLTNPDWYVKGESGTWIDQEVWEWRVQETTYQYRTHFTYDYRQNGQIKTYAMWNGTVVRLDYEYETVVSGSVGLPTTIRYRYQRGKAQEERAPYRSPSGISITTKVVLYSVQKVVRQKEKIQVFRPSECLNLYDVIGDYRIYDAERASHFEGPEHEVVYVNEQLKQKAVDYTGLSYMALRLNSTREWSSFEQLSAYIKQGVLVERLIDDEGVPVAVGTFYGPTNNLAEIVYTLLTSRRLGAGEAVGPQCVNRERMQQAAQWCHGNQFTWDGVLGEPVNLRQWIYEQAGYALLDFTIIGGQFSLMPSFPATSSFRLKQDGKPEIAALFTDGNIRDLKVAWLRPEERQLFKGVAKWRQESANGFSRTRILSIRLAERHGGSDSDPEESFDLSLFCTTEEQTRLFLRVALMLRKHVEHGVTFETTPQFAMGMEPGAYFRLVTEVAHTSRFRNGSISPTGLINTVTDLPDGDHPILYWRPGTEGVQQGTMPVVGGRCEKAAMWGTVFTVVTTAATSRVYKAETITYAREGWVTISGSHQPLTEDGTLAVLAWDDKDFVEEGA
jgi:hypothetical protein